MQKNNQKEITKKLHITWKGIIQRCTNPTHKDYKDYGGRGITVCKEWLNVENFIDDMIKTYQSGLSIDRINPNGNYEPNNCRWATKTTQSRNTRLLRIDNTTGYRGIVAVKGTTRFVARIRVNKKIYIGTYNTAIEAAQAYDQYIIDNNLEHTKNF